MLGSDGDITVHDALQSGWKPGGGLDQTVPGA
jgi:hypothetical protein